MVTLLHRYAIYKGVETDVVFAHLYSISDSVSGVSDWALEAVNWTIGIRLIDFFTEEEAVFPQLQGFGSYLGMLHNVMRFWKTDEVRMGEVGYV